jgi:transcriptional regulator with XRE-family HTH domain
LRGERIRQLRERKGISQEALSFEIEVRRTYVSLIEQARRYPSIQTLLNISEKLDITLADLFTGVEERAKALSKGGRPSRKHISGLPKVRYHQIRRVCENGPRGAVAKAGSHSDITTAKRWPWSE